MGIHPVAMVGCRGSIALDFDVRLGRSWLGGLVSYLGFVGSRGAFSEDGSLVVGLRPFPSTCLQVKLLDPSMSTCMLVI